MYFLLVKQVEEEFWPVLPCIPSCIPGSHGLRVVTVKITRAAKMNSQVFRFLRCTSINLADALLQERVWGVK